MRAIKICIGAFIGFTLGILCFIALGSVFESFSILKPAELYRHAPQKSLIAYFLLCYPIIFMIIGLITGGFLTLILTKRKPDLNTSDLGAKNN